MAKLLREFGMGEKKGRGGKRPGAGRPRNPLKGAKITVYLGGDEAGRLQERAQAEGITPYAWIVRTIRSALKKR